MSNIVSGEYLPTTFQVIPITIFSTQILHSAQITYPSESLSQNLRIHPNISIFPKKSTYIEKFEGEFVSRPAIWGRVEYNHYNCMFIQRMLIGSLSGTLEDESIVHCSVLLFCTAVSSSGIIVRGKNGQWTHYPVLFCEVKETADDACVEYTRRGCEWYVTGCCCWWLVRLCDFSVALFRVRRVGRPAMVPWHYECGSLLIKRIDWWSFVLSGVLIILETAEILKLVILEDWSS